MVENTSATPPKAGKVEWLRPDQILVEEGFNGRDFSHPDNIEHLANIKASIFGSGGVKEPIKIRRDAKQVYIVNGETRWRAVSQLWEEGHTNFFLPAIEVPKGTTETDRYYLQIEANTGHPFAPHELAGRVKKLVDLGESTATIAARLGKTTTAVENMLKYLEAPVAVQAVVKTGEISFTEAVEVVRKHGGTEGAEIVTKAVEIAREEAAEKHAKAVADAEAKGQEAPAEPPQARATRKHTTAAKAAANGSTGKLGPSAPVPTGPGYKPPYDAMKKALEDIRKVYPNSIEMKRIAETALTGVPAK